MASAPIVLPGRYLVSIDYPNFLRWANEQLTAGQYEHEWWTERVRGRLMTLQTWQDEQNWEIGCYHNMHKPKNRWGVKEVEISLVHFAGRYISRQDSEEELRALGLRHAAIEHCLALGAKYPDVQRQFPIAFLGSHCFLSANKTSNVGPGGYGYHFPALRTGFNRPGSMFESVDPKLITITRKIELQDLGPYEPLSDDWRMAAVPKTVQPDSPITKVMRLISSLFSRKSKNKS